MKKVNLHAEFDPENVKSILDHPAMKEIQAISKLSHKNIVGYKGCWVESDEPDTELLQRICSKIKSRNARRGI